MGALFLLAKQGLKVLSSWTFAKPSIQGAGQRLTLETGASEEGGALSSPR